MRSKLSSGKIKYEYDIKNIGEQAFLLTVKIPSHNFIRTYIIKDSFVVSTEYYYSRNWQIISSDHFNFFISDKALFNDYSIKVLEEFLTKMFDVLMFTANEKNLLKEKKVYYFLCKDDEEIKKVTGFTTRGMYVLAQDYIVTTYSTHFHEILHFLINLKLKTLPLYTHPFLQEGFAVAFGGRGGLDVKTILDMGAFMVKSGFVRVNELLNKSDFKNTDASISYPVSGLYITLLIKNFGVEKFIELYRKYSGNSENDFPDNFVIKDLLSENSFIKFADSLLNENPIKINYKEYSGSYKSLSKQKDFEVYEDKDKYFFKIKNPLLIKTTTTISSYESKYFKELFPSGKYGSEEFLITANENEVSVYNLFTNNLIGKYVAGFSTTGKLIPDNKGLFDFEINKNLFKKELKPEYFKSYDVQ